MAALLLACILPIRRRWYEVFLRTHQLLAGLALFMVWVHIRGVVSVTARYAVVATVSIFGTTWVLQLCGIIVLNRLFLHGLPRARAVVKSNIVRLTVDVPVVLEIHPGQYVNVCVPGISWTSLLQSHPFVVATAQRHEGSTMLELVVRVRRGWTSKLHRRALRDGERHHDRPAAYRCLLSGPHGPRQAIDKYGVVVLIASGCGVIGLLPYLQGLIDGYNSFTTKARRIHLIWQLHDAGEWTTAQTSWYRD